MSIFGNNKRHNDKFLKEIRNRIMMKILSIIPTSLVTFHTVNCGALHYNRSVNNQEVFHDHNGQLVLHTERQW